MVDKIRHERLIPAHIPVILATSSPIHSTEKYLSSITNLLRSQQSIPLAKALVEVQCKKQRQHYRHGATLRTADIFLVEV